MKSLENKGNFDILRGMGGLVREIQQRSNRNFQSIGLHNNQFIYIIRAVEQPGMYLGEMSDAVQIDRTTSYRTIKKLEAAGFLELKSDAQNQKIKRIFPTKKAQTYYPELHDYEQSCSDELIAPLTDEEQKILQDLINKMLKH